ncbi:exonuclease SbcCD subunit D [Candidatus Woesearchaeota archaeon]|nr:exonuclease SbcCD subunit D [Candidatus Woesearchaeota archaeon]
MKFAHLSDCHIGGWHESSLRDINLKSFQKAIEVCIEEYVGFVLISGDLFDTALPSIDIIKETALLLSKLKNYDIPVYIIPGSHDFSASGKTMLDVLENAGLVHNVMKFESENKLNFTVDRTGTKITGFYGKRGGLETSEYEKLIKEHLENENGLKIFMFHSILNEIKNNKFELIDGLSLSLLPKNFTYYAGGHPHFIHNEYIKNYGIIAYPGPIFPNNFQELEELKHGGLYIIEKNDGSELKIKHLKLEVIHTDSYFINAENKDPKEVEEEILNKVRDFKDKIITLRIEGCLISGKTSDINFNLIKERFSESYCLLKNTNKLTTKEFQEIELEYNNADEIETKILQEFSLKSKFSLEFIKEMMQNLDKEKFDGEKNSDFELRIIKDLTNLIKL